MDKGVRNKAITNQNLLGCEVQWAVYNTSKVEVSSREQNKGNSFRRRIPFLIPLKF